MRKAAIWLGGISMTVTVFFVSMIVGVGNYDEEGWAMLSWFLAAVFIGLPIVLILSITSTVLAFVKRREEAENAPLISVDKAARVVSIVSLTPLVFFVWVLFFPSFTL